MCAALFLTAAHAFCSKSGMTVRGSSQFFPCKNGRMRTHTQQQRQRFYKTSILELRVYSCEHLFVNHQWDSEREREGERVETSLPKSPSDLFNTISGSLLVHRYVGTDTVDTKNPA